MAQIAPIAFRVSPELKAKLEAAAAADRRSISALINVVLIEWCEGRMYAPGQIGVAGAPAASPVQGQNFPVFRAPAGRRRDPSTREKALDQAGVLEPWLGPIIRKRELIVIDDIIAETHKGDPKPPQAGLSKAIANLLHGLGYDEWIARHADGSEQRVWKLPSVTDQA